MRLPHVRFTVRRTMVLVAIVAIVLMGGLRLSEQQAIAEREPCRFNLKCLFDRLARIPIRVRRFPAWDPTGRGLAAGAAHRWVPPILPWTDLNQNIRAHVPNSLVGPFGPPAAVVYLGRHPGGRAMDFPILDLMDQQACYHKLLGLLHPDGLTCPRCGGDRR